MKDKIYGPKFRELRNEQNITLVEAAKGITSKSTLSLWEKGNDNLSFLQVLKLLNKINIQPIEFLENLISPNMQKLIYKIDLAYTKSDTSTLHEYAIERLKTSRINPQYQSLFLEACITCNFYQDLSNDFLLTPHETERINSILGNISEWNYANIFYFCNSLGLLDVKNIYKLASSLITYSINQKLYLRRWYQDILNSILNAIAILLRKDYPLAEKLLIRFDHMPISDRYAYEKMHSKIFHAFITYIKTKNDYEVSKIIEATKSLELNDLTDGFITGFKQIKKMYE